MRSLIFICFSLVGLTFSQTIELKKTESTYGLFFKSDVYAKNMDQRMLELLMDFILEIWL